MVPDWRSVNLEASCQPACLTARACSRDKSPGTQACRAGQALLAARQRLSLRQMHLRRYEIKDVRNKGVSDQQMLSSLQEITKGYRTMRTMYFSRYKMCADWLVVTLVESFPSCSDTRAPRQVSRRPLQSGLSRRREKRSGCRYPFCMRAQWCHIAIENSIFTCNPTCPFGLYIVTSLSSGFVRCFAICNSTFRPPTLLL
jgi:hypothetical protein